MRISSVVSAERFAPRLVFPDGIVFDKITERASLADGQLAELHATSPDSSATQGERVGNYEIRNCLERYLVQIETVIGCQLIGQ